MRRAGSVLLRGQSRGSSKYSALPLRWSCLFFSPKNNAQRLEHNKKYNIYSVPVSEVSTLQYLIEFYYSDSISWYREDLSVTIRPSFLRSLSWGICKLLCACKPTMPVLVVLEVIFRLTASSGMRNGSWRIESVWELSGSALCLCPVTSRVSCELPEWNSSSYLTLALQLTDWNIVIMILEHVSAYFALTGTPRNESQCEKQNCSVQM